MKFALPEKYYKILWGMVGIGVIAFAVGFILDANRTWLALLSTGYFVLSIALVGFAFATIQFISGAKWWIVLRRIPETFAAPLWIAGVLITIVAVAAAFHFNHIYEWVDHNIVANDKILQQKTGYLNMPFFLVRLVFYFAVWIILAKLIRKTSNAQDVAKDKETKTKLIKYSAIYTIFFGYSFMLSSIDFLMSLQPHWYTTMFPVYMFANGWFGAIAAMIIILVLVQKQGGLKDVNTEHLHDLGKWLLMATVFWAYIAYCMHMLAWYANLPEETYLLELRLKGIWKLYTIILWTLHFVIPFLILLSSDIKRRPARLSKVAWFCLFVTFMDIIWVVYGSALAHKGQENLVNSFPVGPLEIGAFFGAVGAFGIVFFKSFAKVNEAPTGDIHYEESRHFHQTY